MLQTLRRQRHRREDRFVGYLHAGFRFLAAYRAKLLVTPASQARSESISRNRCDPLEDVRLSSEVSLVLVGGNLFDARTLRQTWPIERDYGPRPWTNDDITRTDVRADDYWDRRR